MIDCVSVTNYMTSDDRLLFHAIWQKVVNDSTGEVPISLLTDIKKLILNFIGTSDIINIYMLVIKRYFPLEPMNKNFY